MWKFVLLQLLLVAGGFSQSYFLVKTNHILENGDSKNLCNMTFIKLVKIHFEKIISHMKSLMMDSFHWPFLEIGLNCLTVAKPF